VALFFDKTWFDITLAARRLSRADLAAAAGASLDDLTAMFKDQMEVPSSHVTAWAALLGQSETEIVGRCGISTRIPEPVSDALRIAKLEERIAALEGLVSELSRQSDEARQAS
jgi:hypothetical protein